MGDETEWDYNNSDHQSVVEEDGVVMRKKPSDVYMLQQDEDFSVITNEGKVTGHAGDYVAYDPQSGHMWPVSKEYVDMHYETVEG